MKTKEPLVNSLPLHPIIKNRLENLNAELAKSAKPSGTIKRHLKTLDFKKFPTPYSLNSR